MQGSAAPSNPECLEVEVTRAAMNAARFDRRDDVGAKGCTGKNLTVVAMANHYVRAIDFCGEGDPPAVASTIDLHCEPFGEERCFSDAQRLSSAARGGRRPKRVGWNEGLGVFLSGLPVLAAPLGPAC